MGVIRPALKKANDLSDLQLRPLSFSPASLPNLVHNGKDVAVSVDHALVAARTGRCQRSFAWAQESLKELTRPRRQRSRNRDCQRILISAFTLTPKRKHPPQGGICRNIDLEGRSDGHVGREPDLDAVPD